MRRETRGTEPIEFVNYIESDQRSKTRHVMETFNPNENLPERIFSKNNTRKAWKRVKANTGKTRPLGIPTIMDRLIQQAICRIPNTIFDPGFPRFSYGFREGKSARQAVYQLREYIREGYRVAIDTDLSKFFDTVEHVF